MSEVEKVASSNYRLPGNLNITFPSLNGQSIISSMPKIAISNGSACTSSSPKASHVLTEIGLSKNRGRIFNFFFHIFANCLLQISTKKNKSKYDLLG